MRQSSYPGSHGQSKTIPSKHQRVLSIEKQSPLFSTKNHFGAISQSSQKSLRNSPNSLFPSYQKTNDRTSKSIGWTTPFPEVHQQNNFHNSEKDISEQMFSLYKWEPIKECEKKIRTFTGFPHLNEKYQPSQSSSEYDIGIWEIIIQNDLADAEEDKKDTFFTQYYFGFPKNGNAYDIGTHEPLLGKLPPMLQLSSEEAMKIALAATWNKLKNDPKLPRKAIKVTIITKCGKVFLTRFIEEFYVYPPKKRS